MRTNVPGGLWVVGLSTSGDRVHQARVDHGSHPETVLAVGGWSAGPPVSATTRPDGALELAYLVTGPSGIPPAREEVPRDADVAADEHAEPYQRVAAYAVVTSERGVLMTQFTSLTHVAGEWGLPGGGLDHGEAPVDGVHREVWEETGQRIVLGDLVTIQSQHWVGRAPGGGVEDFHAVRIVYRATCPEPTDVVIHDVGGTTGDARWVPVDEVSELPITSSWRSLPELTRITRRGDGAG
ncbi:NUDIX hydrolase [Intrasporangium oryzae NRRL B-24470]|uniref:NUDIX hydrolase n=1 Tax=Intrasporangium oryzae NRRL B-24470 TaxID=1386089 RepID=W9G9H6_9MICO|nr:NUDIX domain-containing protein [Intrasporangium oryzae]EWT02851.1 NUDIX hydrolase [Intrasporangium oryzae NRRL B-24470]